MTTKKTNGIVEAEEWTLSLPSQENLVKESMQSYRSAVSRHRPRSKGEERVAAEGNKQLLVVEFEALKAYNATQENAKVHEVASTTFFGLAMHHEEQIQEASGTHIAQMVQQYARFDLDATARQNQKLVRFMAKGLSHVTTV